MSGQEEIYHANGGFTLVELMATIAIMAVMMAIAVPAFTELRNRSRIVSTANEMIAAIQVARNEAVRNNRRVLFCRATSAAPEVCAGSEGNWENWVVGLDSDSDGVINTVYKRAVIPSGVVVRDSAAIQNGVVTVWADGRAHSGGNVLTGTFAVCLATTRPTENEQLIHVGTGMRISSGRQVDANCQGAVGDN